MRNFIRNLFHNGSRQRWVASCRKNFALCNGTLNFIRRVLTKRFMKEMDMTTMKVKPMKRARCGMGISFSTK